MDLIIRKISLAFKCKFYFQYKCEIRIFDMKSLNKLMRGNKGATAVEYAIIAALVAVVAATGFGTLGNGISTKAGNIATTITG